MDAFFHAGKHLTGAHGHIVYRHIARMGKIRIGEQKVGHKVNDVAAGEVRSRLLAEGLREAPHQILEDIAAVHGADAVRAKVSLGGVEFLDDQIEGVALHQTFDDILEVELCQHILHIGGKACQIITEIRLDVFRVGQQPFKVEFAGVIELVAGGAGQKSVDHGKFLHVGIGILHLLPSGKKAVMEIYTLLYLYYAMKTSMLFRK